MAVRARACHLAAASLSRKHARRGNRAAGHLPRGWDDPPLGAPRAPAGLRLGRFLKPVNYARSRDRYRPPHAAPMRALALPRLRRSDRPDLGRGHHRPELPRRAARGAAPRYGMRRHQLARSRGARWGANDARHWAGAGGGLARVSHPDGGIRPGKSFLWLERAAAAGPELTASTARVTARTRPSWSGSRRSCRRPRLFRVQRGHNRRPRRALPRRQIRQ